MKLIASAGFCVIAKLCILFKVDFIVHDLTKRSGQTHDAAQIQNVQVQFDGRYAVLTGDVFSPDDINKSECIVADVG